MKNNVERERWLDEVVTLTEGAALRRVSIDTLRNEAKRGRIKVLHLSERRRGITRREALKDMTNGKLPPSESRVTPSHTAEANLHARILQRLDDIDRRLTALEEKVS